ncbi:MAG: cobaltochelatase subunit CobN, partial [Mesorhizobium sp.]
MHILTTTSASLDDLAEPVDLRQTPADVVALSFTDSDLAGLAAAWQADADRLPSMRLAALRDLRHPMSVDLWIDSVARHARVVLVRILGGYDWWRYGCDQLASTARAHGIKLALLPGECRDEDLRLIEGSTLPRQELDGLLGYFREGGPENMTALVRRLARLAGRDAAVVEPVVVPKAGFYEPGRGVVPLPLEGRVRPQAGGGVACEVRQHSEVRQQQKTSSTAATTPPGPAGHPPLEGEGDVVPILFYRSMLLAADVAPIEALFEALGQRGMIPVPIFVSSLKDPVSLAFVERALASLKPAAIITATAFASGAEPGVETPFDRAGVPVFQVIVATTRRDIWQDNQRGLAPADLAMHVVLPELDGRILAGAVSFKGESEVDPALAFRAFANRPEPDRVAQVANRVEAFVRLQRTPREKRKLAILIPDYPSAPGRTGYAVGLDVPSSVLAMLHDLSEQGYVVEGIPQTPRALLEMLEAAEQGLALKEYLTFSKELPPAAVAAVEAAWGNAEDETGLCEAPPSVLPDISPTWGEIAGRTEGGATEHQPSSLANSKQFPFRATSFGNITVAIAPDRGRSVDRRADYHDPILPPRHALIAFGLWLRKTLDVHALVHVGAHGTLEWLPGKTVALSESCFPEIVTGPLPVIYPFIVSNPGEAAQAKRRIAAVTLGHLPPPLTGAGLD